MASQELHHAPSGVPSVPEMEGTFTYLYHACCVALEGEFLCRVALTESVRDILEIGRSQRPQRENAFDWCRFSDGFGSLQDFVRRSA